MAAPPSARSVAILPRAPWFSDQSLLPAIIASILARSSCDFGLNLVVVPLRNAAICSADGPTEDGAFCAGTVPPADAVSLFCACMRSSVAIPGVTGVPAAGMRPSARGGEPPAGALCCAPGSNEVPSGEGFRARAFAPPPIDPSAPSSIGNVTGPAAGMALPMFW